MTAEEQPGQQEPGQEPDGTQAERLDRVEDKLDRLTEAVSKLVPSSHADAQHREEQRLDRGSTVADQVRAELERRDKEAADAQAADAEKADHQSVRDRLAALEEHKPAPPVRRSTILLGWGDPRDER